MATELKASLKVGQKWLDAEGTIRHIMNVSGNRVTYSFKHPAAGERSVMGGSDPKAFSGDILIADEGSVTFTNQEAKWLKRMLAGYSVGKVGQSVLDKLKDVK